MKHVVVIGAGQAGSSCVAKLRKSGFEGKLTLLGDESAPPYQRPPLSKAYLLGEMALERMFLRPESYYAQNDIDLRLNTKVTTIDAAGKQLQLEQETIDYDALVLCTGSRPNLLPARIGGDLDGVFAVRTLADVEQMAPRFRAGAKVLIVGGGYIGLEAAAVAAKLGLEVTLVEMSERILQRVAAPQTSDFFRQLHQKHGVDIREATGLAQLKGESHVTQATLSDGSTLDVDFVIVGVGITPNTELAEAAGVVLENGIRVDEFGRSSDPHIWAAGDCASFPYQGERIRLESVPNAIDQAEIVAQNIMGEARAYQATPWFWSDQYDVKLQIAGLNTGYDRVITRQTNESSVSFWYYRAEQLLAVDAANDPRGYMIGKRLIEAGKSPDPAIIQDPGKRLEGPAQIMRIIAGQWRGVALAALGKGDAGAQLRPTSDRVRESLFSMLTHRDVIENARVLDLFAGTGALAFEALSRGAQSAVLVENGRVAQKLISQNIAKLRIEPPVQVLRKDATKLQKWTEDPFDLVFLDPPYGRDLGQKALSCAHQNGWIRKGASIIWEEATPMTAPLGFALQDSRRFGDTHISFLTYSGEI